MPAMHLRLAGLGAFPEGGRRPPRVLWVGLEGDLDVLRELREAVLDVARGMDIPLEEHQEFRPHVTLGRIKRPSAVKEGIEGIEGWRALEARSDWRAERCLLFESRLTPEGPAYRIHCELGVPA